MPARPRRRCLARWYRALSLNLPGDMPSAMPIQRGVGEAPLGGVSQSEDAVAWAAAEQRPQPRWMSPASMRWRQGKGSRLRKEEQERAAEEEEAHQNVAKARAVRDVFFFEFLYR